jgi:hypothetical protein
MEAAAKAAPWGKKFRQPRRISVLSGQRSTLVPAMRYNQAVEPTSSPCSSFFSQPNFIEISKMSAFIGDV